MSKTAKIFFVRKYGENLVYLFFWFLVYTIPILMMYVRTRNHADETFDWDEIVRVWIIEAMFLVLFVLHNFFLAPLLVYKNRRRIYLAIVSVMVVAFAVFEFTFDPLGPRKKHHKFRTEMRKCDGNATNATSAWRSADKPDGNMPPAPQDDKFLHRGPRHRPFMVDQFDFITVIVFVLMLGMNLGIKLLFKQEEDEKKLQQLKNENLNQQLEYLKYQINPHFFMNTLNNIHALVDIDPEKAKESIIELSKLMRYVLYDGNLQMASLQRESDFIDNYIELMRLRYCDKVDIKVERDKSLPDAMIAPLITITYVENAFKHGVSYSQKSFIYITTHVHDRRFLFTCSNSKHKESTEEHGGVGLENTRKRLNLIYGDDYKLSIEDGEKTYIVKLDIPLNFSHNVIENASSEKSKPA